MEGTDDAKIDASKAGNVTSQLERPHNVIILLGRRENDGKRERSGGENSMFVLSDAECILMDVEKRGRGRERPPGGHSEARGGLLPQGPIYK